MKLLHQGNQQLRLSLRHRLDFPVHLHNALELVWLTAGQCTASCGSEQVPLSTGDIFIAFPGQVHGYSQSDGAAGYVLIIPMTPYLESFRGVLEQNIPLSPLLSKGSWEHTGIGSLLEMAASDAQTAPDKVMQGYILVLMGKLLPLLALRPVPAGNPDAIQALLIFINSHYTEPLSRQDIAHAIGYHESYISHLFSDVLHTTLTDYITALRMDDARRLLKDTRLTVSRIALSLGFGSIRSFNRVFIKQTGMTPTAYRRKLTLNS